MSKVVILGSGAAPGVPSLSKGFGACNPNNPKNYRLRSATYFELSGVKFLVDTGPDLRIQLLNNNIRALDAVFYTHAHADHLHGIDELREINRISQKVLKIYASENNIKKISERFNYLIVDENSVIHPSHSAALVPIGVKYHQSFMIQGLKVTAIELNGHSTEVTGYVFNDGEVVFIADFMSIPQDSLKEIKREPEVLIMPLTAPEGVHFHANFDEVMRYAELIKPKKLILNHLAVESDYDAIKEACVGKVGAPEPAYDGMVYAW